MLSAINPLSRYNYHERIKKMQGEQKRIDIKMVDSGMSADIARLITDAKSNHKIKNKTLKELTRSDVKLTPVDVIRVLQKNKDVKSTLILDIATLINQEGMKEWTNMSETYKAILCRKQEYVAILTTELDGVRQDKLLCHEELNNANDKISRQQKIINKLMMVCDDLERRNSFALGVIANLRDEVDQLKVSD